MKAYKLRIELISSEPLIWRRMIIPAGATFYRFYDAIQRSMGWLGAALTEYHPYEFDLSEENLIITNDLEAIEDNKLLKARYKKYGKKILDPFGEIERQLKRTVKGPSSVKIDTYIEKYDQIKYTYDFGDNWQHLITLEAVLDDYPFGYPALLSGQGDCPPEDVGGWTGYEEFLKVYKNPKHRDHQSTVNWAKEQRYEPFDLERTNDFLRFVKIQKTEWESLGLGDGHYNLTGHELDKYR